VGACGHCQPDIQLHILDLEVLTQAADHVTVGPVARSSCRGEAPAEAVDYLR
jgi:hypothetical protein